MKDTACAGTFRNMPTSVSAIPIFLPIQSPTISSQFFWGPLAHANATWKCLLQPLSGVCSLLWMVTSCFLSSVVTKAPKPMLEVTHGYQGRGEATHHCHGYKRGQWLQIFIGNKGLGLQLWPMYMFIPNGTWKQNTRMEHNTHMDEAWFRVPHVLAT